MSNVGQPGEVSSVEWSRSDLRKLVAHRTVYQLRPIAGRDQAGAAIPVPDWLLEASAGADEATWSDRLRSVHPHDRASVAAAWRSAVACPGTTVAYTARARAGDELHLFEELMLNLEGHDGLDVLVARSTSGPTPDLDDWEVLEAEYDFKSTPVAIEYLDEYGTMLMVEGQVQEIFGRPADELIGRWALEHIDEQHHGTLLALWLSLIAEPGRIQSVRLQIVRPDLSRVWVETTLMNRLADERIGAVVVLSHDITDQLASEEAAETHEVAMRRSHEEFTVLANQVPAAVFRADADGQITFANAQWMRLAGVEDPLDAAPADLPLSLFDIAAGDDREVLASALLLLFGSDDAGTTSIEVRSRHGERVFCLACQSVSAPSTGVARVVIGSMTDVTSTTELRHRALHDGLTGLLNRSGIDACLDEALEDAQAPVVVAFVDLDGFKVVNDHCGHEVGDGVLRAIAGRLREAMRPSDHLGRYGGDEFVIVCPNASEGAEEAVAARIEAVMSSPIDIPGGTWMPGASIGLARSRVGEPASSVMRRADQSMYETKRARQRAAR